jgi:hypothetical protein
MARSTRSSVTTEQDAGTRPQATASYIYGIVPGNVERLPEARGVGDPPGRIRLVRHGDIAAVVSDLQRSRRLGRPDDLLAHEQLLDVTAAEVSAVLPLRFGAVMESDEAIVRELLTPHHDEFRSALAEFEGLTEYVVKARYDEQEAWGRHPSAGGGSRSACRRHRRSRTDSRAGRRTPGRPGGERLSGRLRRGPGGVPYPMGGPRHISSPRSSRPVRLRDDSEIEVEAWAWPSSWSAGRWHRST